MLGLPAQCAPTTSTNNEMSHGRTTTTTHPELQQLPTAEPKGTEARKLPSTHERPAATMLRGVMLAWTWPSVCTASTAQHSCRMMGRTRPAKEDTSDDTLDDPSNDNGHDAALEDTSADVDPINGKRDKERNRETERDADPPAVADASDAVGGEGVVEAPLEPAADEAPLGRVLAHTAHELPGQSVLCRAAATTKSRCGCGR